MNIDRRLPKKFIFFQIFTPIGSYYWECHLCVTGTKTFFFFFFFFFFFLSKFWEIVTVFQNRMKTWMFTQKTTFALYSYNEPPHDKTNKMTCAPSEDSDQPGHPPSLIRVFAVCMKKALVLIYPLSAQRGLIRLGGYQDWPESSLGAQPLYWFCHEAAHIHIINIKNLFLFLWWLLEKY